MCSAIAFVAIAAAIISAISCSAQVQAQQLVSMLDCTDPASCISMRTSSCRRAKIPVGVCTPSQNQFIQLSVVENQICVNATRYADDQCSSFISSIAGGCTTCLPVNATNDLRYDCGGLFGSMFLLSACTDNTCGQCASSRIPYNRCRAAPGLNFVNIGGEFMCTQVSAGFYSDSACSQQISHSRYASGSCFGKKSFTVLS